VFHQTHATVLWPALPIVVSHDVFIVWIRVFGEITLDEFSGLIAGELKEDVEVIYVTEVDADGVFGLEFD
jgi:hypothetical protein